MSNFIKNTGIYKLAAYLFRKRYCMVHTDYCGFNISIKAENQKALDAIKSKIPEYEFIECGLITYFFMKNSMPNVAMLSFWR